MESFVNHFWAVSVELALPLFIGALVAGCMQLLLDQNFLFRHLHGNRFSSVLKAVCLGLPLPVCSCGVIPLAVSLKEKGAGKGAVNGFVVSTPQTGVDSLLVAAAFLGWPFAVFKLLLALVLGLITGFCSAACDKESLRLSPKVLDEAKERQSLRVKLKLAYSYAISDILGSIWLWLLVGIVLSALLAVFMEGVQLSESLAGFSLLKQMFLMLIVSLPLYVCATASIPVAAALVTAGVEPAAVLIFLIAGPATNAVAVSAITKVLGWKHLFIQLLVVVLGSLIAGYLFSSYIYDIKEGHHHVHQAGWLSQLAAVSLLSLFLLNAIRMIRQKLNKVNVDTKVEVLSFLVVGMNCGGCVKKITDFLAKQDGVTLVRIDLAKALLEVQAPGMSCSEIIESFRELGFELSELEVEARRPSN